MDKEPISITSGYEFEGTIFDCKACMPYVIVRVAPFMGAWIETILLLVLRSPFTVAPFMGAWIETNKAKTCGQSGTLLPLWEHGLKPLSCLFTIFF